jgi:hypothetical protein
MIFACMPQPVITITMIASTRLRTAIPCVPPQQHGTGSLDETIDMAPREMMRSLSQRLFRPATSPKSKANRLAPFGTMAGSEPLRDNEIMVMGDFLVRLHYRRALGVDSLHALS